MPFDPVIGCPLMLGRVVLDELPHIVGQDLPVMGLPFGLGEIKLGEIIEDNFSSGKRP
jgi:hypothetical protein